MNLKEFIEKLEKIKKEYGPSVEVKMADGISVVEPVYLSNFLSKEAVIVTDRK